MKTVAIALALVAVAATGCKTGGDSASTAKDFGNPDQSAPQQVSTLVPTGGSTTALLGLAVPITANSLEIHTTCNLQLAQLYVQSEIGVGYMAPSGNDPNIWVTPSGQTRTFTAIQIVVNNFGAPAFCTYSVSAPVPVAIAE